MLTMADLELLTSGDPSALASQSAGIIGVSHRAQPTFFKKTVHRLCMMAYICNPALWEAKVGGSLEHRSSIADGETLSLQKLSRGMVAHTCSPSY